MLTGHHLIAGQWVATSDTITSDPVSGSPLRVCLAGPVEVDAAATAAEAAAIGFAWMPADRRARLLERIASEIEALGSALIAQAQAETGLPQARLEGERGRTTGQLRLFADHIRQGRHLDTRHDPALPERTPLPRPELRLLQRPIGPVAVFGSSNFPLAFSVAGGDTAAALAAGCPVVVKGHPAHPGTSELVAGAILAALLAEDCDPGIFALLQGTIDAGTALVRHPLIRAVGFTGSLAAGRALFDLCAARPDPIPFFGELGSINPVFLLPAALAARAETIGQGHAQSLSLGVGQFCTNPGVSFAVRSAEAEAFLTSSAEALAQVPAQPMLTQGIANAYGAGLERLRGIAGLDHRVQGRREGRNATPHLAVCSLSRWQQDHRLAEEIFGPVGLVVLVDHAEDLLAVAQGLSGQLTATLQADRGDHPLLAGLLPILERKAGRILANGFPTGVEVCDAMVHGGPYPASTNFGATSVGTMAIRRFLRPVCYQNLPMDLLPG